MSGNWKIILILFAVMDSRCCVILFCCPTFIELIFSLQFSVNVKFPRTRLSNSSSSGGDSRKESESSNRQGSEEIAQELFANIEQFTKQAKKAAESLESAVEARKTKVINRKTGTLEDMENVRKNVVDDFKSALKTLGDSNEVESVKVSEPQSDNKAPQPQKCDTETRLFPPEDKEEIRPFIKGSRTRTISETVSNHYPEEDLHPSQVQSASYDIIGNIDMYTLASQTQDFFGGLLGKSHFSSLDLD